MGINVPTFFFCPKPVPFGVFEVWFSNGIGPVFNFGVFCRAKYDRNKTKCLTAKFQRDSNIFKLGWMEIEFAVLYSANNPRFRHVFIGYMPGVRIKDEFRGLKKILSIHSQITKRNQTMLAERWAK